MIITNYQVQHVLRAYSRQLADGPRLSRDKLSKATQKDEVTLSAESKKMLMVDKIANQLVAHLTHDPERNETEQEILNRLSQEFGRPLEVGSDNGNGLVFKIVDPSSGGATEYVSSTEAEALKKRLAEIARAVVYEKLG
jgi:hypothetical protein